MSIFLSPKSTLVVKIKEGSPGRSHILTPGSKVAAAILLLWVGRVVFEEWDIIKAVDGREATAEVNDKILIKTGKSARSFIDDRRRLRAWSSGRKLFEKPGSIQGGTSMEGNEEVPPRSIDFFWQRSKKDRPSTNLQNASPKNEIV